jgi:hypothetical protein
LGWVIKVIRRRIVIIIAVVHFVVYLKGLIIVITFLQSFSVILVVNYYLFVAAPIYISITTVHNLTKGSIPK